MPKAQSVSLPQVTSQLFETAVPFSWFIIILYPSTHLHSWHRRDGSDRGDGGFGRRRRGKLQRPGLEGHPWELQPHFWWVGFRALLCPAVDHCPKTDSFSSGSPSAVSGTYHSLSSVVLPVTVRGCYIGEITTTENDLCKYCPGDSYRSVWGVNTLGAPVWGARTLGESVWFGREGVGSERICGALIPFGRPEIQCPLLHSFYPANTTCDSCDTTMSTCDFNKSALAVPTGNILVPQVCASMMLTRMHVIACLSSS